MAKIKHWQGYGYLNATVTGKGKDYKDIEISGNHEWGLTWGYADNYRVKTWLGRFIPKDKDLDRYIIVAKGFKSIENCDTDFAVYRLYFNA